MMNRYLENNFWNSTRQNYSKYRFNHEQYKRLSVEICYTTFWVLQNLEFATYFEFYKNVRKHYKKGYIFLQIFAKETVAIKAGDNMLIKLQKVNATVSTLEKS